MSKEEIDSSRFPTLRVFRIENGWVVETKEGDLFPKTKAYSTPRETLEALHTWLISAGIGAQNVRKVQGLKKHIAEAFND